MTDPTFNFAFDLDDSTVSLDSVRTLTDSIRSSMTGRTKSSIRHNIESTMKDRSSQLSLKKTQSIEEIEENEENEEIKEKQDSTPNEANFLSDFVSEKHDSTSNFDSAYSTKELLRLLEESRRVIDTLQKEKEDERAYVMRLYEEDKKRREKAEEDEKEQRKLDALYALLLKQFDSELNINLYSQEEYIKRCDNFNKIVDQFKLTGEITLFLRTPTTGTDANGKFGDGNNGIMITNRNVYFLYFKRIVITSEGLVISPMYTFTETLNSKYVELIYNMTQLPINGKRVSSKIPTMKYGPSKELKAHELDFTKNFESIIRYIPGGYINGHWKQLDGFYGMYLNEQTMELSDIPPPLV